MSLYDQIREVSHHPETKAEIVESYREMYTGRGKAGWKQHLIEALSAQTGIKYKTLEKRFDAQRLKNTERKNASQYRELGETLPLLPPSGGYRIHGIIFVKYSEECVEREVDERITGDDAKKLARMASADAMVQAVANAYQSQEGDIDYGGPGIGDCALPDLYVEPIH